MEMMTVKQVASLTGVSVRTLQFYDEIGLLKPARLTGAGYRLYDENALGVLQQILFFKELDFTLKEIKTIMENPDFDKEAVFVKQRNLIRMKRDRLTALLGLLDKLIKGENCMEFKEFDMSGYFHALEEFKKTDMEEIIKQLGTVESFDEMISEMKSREDEIAEMAVKEYGSLEKFTEAMKKNFESFLKNGPSVPKEEVQSRIEETEAVTKRLTADLSRDPASPEVQEITKELVLLVEESNKGMDCGENYWAVLSETYLTNPVFMEVTDKKYGEGASKFIGLALKAYIDG